MSLRTTLMAIALLGLTYGTGYVVGSLTSSASSSIYGKWCTSCETQPVEAVVFLDDEGREVGFVRKFWQPEGGYGGQLYDNGAAPPAE